MASHTIAAGAVAKHDVTLVASTVDTFTFAVDVDTVQIISNGAAAAYYTLDGSTPTVSGANCFALPASAGAVVDERQPKSGDVTVVKVISSGTPVISVVQAR